jgi:sialate O-acetylesterase
MHKLKALFIILIIFSTNTLAFGQVVLPKLISDGMVLQRDVDLKIWGWASPGENVSVHFTEQLYHTVTDQDGKWAITLPPHPAGGPYEMRIEGHNLLIIDDILLGDVWVGSGQSNMELTMERVKDKYPQVVSWVNNTRIRQFEVPDTYSFSGPNTDLKGGKWITANVNDIYQFSAIGYFFANELYNQYKVPIGFINAALGGSPAEAWMSEEALKKFPDHYEELQKFKNPELIRQIESDNKRKSTEWFEGLNWKDAGIKYNWAKTDLDDDDWEQMSVPGYWADNELGEVNGAVWFRKEINIPADKIGKKAQIVLGRIVDADSVFINGQFVGATGYQYPPRKYPVPADFLKEGKNVIAVRIINQSGKGGFVLDKPYSLVFNNKDSLDISGTWKYRLGASMEPMASQTTVRWKPGGLYNAVIAPLLEYPMKGVLWYQGESNTANPGEYEDLMQTLMGDWREKWQQGEFPFVIVQLANYMETNELPGESNWAALRQAQLNTASIPNTGLVVAIDAGEWNDIHPLDKKVIGQRLALQARRLAYGEKDLIASGPRLASVNRKGIELILNFTETGSGLVAYDDEELNHFAIAGDDGKYVWANAKIDGDKVIVWNEDISKPVSVRYAWADNPEGANLYNAEGLPASPFEAQVGKK